VTTAVAHRGDPVGHLENTVPAFLAAIEQGADMIELDCRLSADGEVVVVHDPTLERLWGLDRPVAETSWKEISSLERDGYRIPLLGEVFDSCAAQVMVDVGSAGVIHAAHRVADAAGALERCIFVGDTEALRSLRASDGTARIGLTWDRSEPPGDDLLSEVRPEWFNPHFGLVDPEVVASMGERQIGVSTWTVDREEDMTRVLDAGVEAVITNRVATLVALLTSRAGASA
jgi:glycerophosphoryl diester phosphodiesterase